MGLRTFLDPYAGTTPATDKLIGDAFPMVEAVARRINEIAYVVANMDAIVKVAQGLEAETSSLVLGTMGPLSAPTVLNLPTGVAPSNIRSSDTCIVTSGGDVYTEGSDVFTCRITAGQLRVEAKPGAPSSLLGAQVRWRLTHSA